MDLDLLESGHDALLAAKAAFYSAANAVAIIDGQRQSLDWWACGAPDAAMFSADGEPWTQAHAVATYAGFVRENPGVPPEALFRFAGARGFHGLDPASWEAIDGEWRLAFGAFVVLLPVFDLLLGAEAARAAAARAIDPGPAPVPRALPGLSGLVSREEGLGGGGLIQRRVMRAATAATWDEAAASAEAEAAAPVEAEAVASPDPISPPPAA